MSYVMQIRLGRRDFDIVRESDGAKVAQAWTDLEASCLVIDGESALEELNRLSAENSVLRSEQDEMTRRLRAEVDTLRAKLEAAEAVAKGQVQFEWPAKAY